MQIAACRHSQRLLSRKDEHAVTSNTLHTQFLAILSHRWVLDRRTSERGVAPTTDMSTVLSRLSATVLSLLPRHRQSATAAVVTVIEVGNALKADIERSGLKYREVPISDIAPPIRSTRRH
jgi:hypothetical protein